ncbi:MAG: TldD/PmbA family protein, partial [Alphaproteobacteria bacterium]|nr:TldD/PmbA family protein [Alphaproteobacteria bacterium]
MPIIKAKQDGDFMSDLRNIAEDTVKLALKAGADHADCVVVTSQSLSYGQRLGRVESMEESEGSKLCLRAIVNGAQAIASSNDIQDLQDLAARAVEMARIVPVDNDCLPASKDEIMQNVPETDVLQLFDKSDVTMEMLIDSAKRMEETALAVKGISNSEGSGASSGKTQSALAISNGFNAYMEKTYFGISASMIAGTGDEMQTDYDYSTNSHWQNLKSPELIGKKAAQRVLDKMGAKQAPSMQAPVIFAPRVGRGLLGHFLSAINGEAIYKGTSFLKEKMGQAVFADSINIIEDPHRKQAMGARLFDGEGMQTKKRHWIKDGVLQGWVLDLRTARKLHLQSTANGGRGIGAVPGPSAGNAFISAGTQSVKELLADVKQGFYVTQLMGMGVNGVTGDYSQGAEGFWIENGEITFPVQEMTIAGNLNDMFANLSVADDLLFEQSINVPTIKIAEMTIAGA